MAGPPKRLFIPRKTSTRAHQPDYGTDMRAIEIFNPINKLVAGSGVTLTPSDGTGPQVEIAASGGSATPKFVDMIAAIDSNDWPSVFLPFGPTDPGHQGFSQWLVESNSSGSALHYTIASSWMTIVNAGDSVNILPEFTAPTYTGGPISVEVFMWASDATFANSANYIGTKTVPSGSTVQMATTDFVAEIPASGDLTFVNGTGVTGNGFLSTAGSIVYWAGVSGIIIVPNGTTF